MQFIDEVVIHVKAGDGGNGSAAFRREAFTPRGGPAGGDGGNGGSVILIASDQISTLLDLRYQQSYTAKSGESGRGRDQYGRSGDDILVRVPVGTQIKELDSDELLGDLLVSGDRFVAAQGGQGGRGNIHFATSTNQSPSHAEEGTPGVERSLKLELKLIADVGLLGFPNVGKSTFISAISNARPKIADYPFTTLVPNLGVVRLGEGRNFVLADLPGLIEGASEGHGLGHQFLRHVERTRVLIHLLDGSTFVEEGRTPLRDYDVLCRELAKYSPELAARPQIVALSKADLTETQATFAEQEQLFADRGLKLYCISAVSGQGTKPLLEAVWKILHPITVDRGKNVENR